MSEKKKLKLTKHHEEEHKCTEEYLDAQKEDAGSLADISNCETDKFPLCDLPNEVLLSIYAFLTPVDLAAISGMGNRRLSDLTFCIKEANFSSCRTAGAERILAFFTRNRVKNIKELNFNYTSYIKPTVLVRLISRCKAITVLSVVECNLMFHHLAQIFDNCSHVEELSWNVEEPVQLVTAHANNIKTVYLFCDTKVVTMRTVLFIVRNFLNVKHVWINFSSDSLSVLPFIGSWLSVSCVRYPALDRRFILLTDSFQCISTAGDLQFLQVIIDKLDYINPWCVDNSVDYTASKTITTSQTFMSPPYVQFFSNEEDISELSKFSAAFTTVSVLLTANILDLSEGLIRGLTEAAGVKLKHLSLINKARICQTKNVPESLSIEESHVVIDTLEKLFVTTQYITSLNMVTLHFSAGSPFKAISMLKHLRKLSISTCGFRRNETDPKLPVDSENLEFKDLVLKCALVEEFSLFCCPDDYRRVKETHLLPLKDWAKLKHLTLYSVIFRTCGFLKKVADFCKELESFSFLTVAPERISLFTPDVIYLIKNAKNLRFIRINDERFNPMYERLWSTIGEAVNLEGICIITQSKSAIRRNIVLDAVKKLKHLQSFHFSAARAPDRLYDDVRKSMQDHGIVNFKVECLSHINPFNSASKLQYYHKQPFFCCKHVHFKEFK